MGAWGDAPWDNDEAADWFSEFFKGPDWDARIRHAFENVEDEYDRVRAACYVLQSLGRVYVWPGNVDELGGHLDRGIAALEDMLDPESDAHEELNEMWGEGAGVFDSLRDQLAELRKRRSEGNWD